MVVYVGDDSTEDHHDVHHGRSGGAARRQAAAGGRRGGHCTARTGRTARPAGPGDVVIGIETDRGPWVEALVAAGCAAAAAPALIQHARDAEAETPDVLRRSDTEPLAGPARRRQVAVLKLRDQVARMGDSFSRLPRASRPGSPATVIPPDPIPVAKNEVLGLFRLVAGHPLSREPRLDKVRALADLIANAYEAANVGNGSVVSKQVSLAAAAAILLVADNEAPVFRGHEIREHLRRLG